MTKKRFTVHGNGIVMDNDTGLEWTENANLPEDLLTQQQALDYVAAMNAGVGIYGYTNWRIPSIDELKSLVPFEKLGSAGWLSAQGFTNVVNGLYWSSSISEFDTDHIWVIVLMNWSGAWTYAKAAGGYVWPVRSEKIKGGE